MRRAFVVVFPLLALLATRTASAEPAQTDAVIAQSLFDEGRSLLAAGKVKEACVKLAESQRLDPGGGTLLNLALCHEREGRIATASAELEAATAQAIKDGRKDRESIARDHFAALQPRLPKVIVEVQGAAPDEKVAIDGHPLPSAAWGTATAVDPGEHDVEANAPGRKSLVVHFRAEEAATVRVSVRALDVDPNANAAATKTLAEPVRANPWPVVRLSANDPEATLDEQRQNRWLEACRAPCERKLDPQYVYRVNGKGITPSKAFTIPGDTERVEVEAETGSMARKVVGGSMAALGVIGLLGSAVCLVLGYTLSYEDARPKLQTAGFIALGGGAVLTAGGFLIGLGGSTDVHARPVR